MKINYHYRIEEKDQRLTLEIIKNVGFDSALEQAYNKALYLVANTPTSTLATEWLAWSQNLLTDSRKTNAEEIAEDLRLLSLFYRKLAHKIYWHLRRTNQLDDMTVFIRLVD